MEIKNLKCYLNSPMPIKELKKIIALYSDNALIKLYTSEQASLSIGEPEDFEQNTDELIMEQW